MLRLQAPRADGELARATRGYRCLVLAFDGAISFRKWKDVLWAEVYAGARPRLRGSATTTEADPRRSPVVRRFAPAPQTQYRVVASAPSCKDRLECMPVSFGGIADRAQG
jgi:hypothetical protein